MVALLIFLLSIAAVRQANADYNLIKNPAYCQNRTTTYSETRENGVAVEIMTRICPMFDPKTLNGVFPNPTEKKILFDTNFARLFPEQFRMENGGFTYASSGNPVRPASCGMAQSAPYYWSPSTTDGARFQHFTCQQCSQQCGNGGHATCVDVTNYISVARKWLFGWNRHWIESEAICPSIVTCMAQDIGHCGIFFNPTRSLFGPGFGNLPGQRGFVANGVMSKSLAPERHPLPVGVHYREGDDLVFRAVYFSKNPDGSALYSATAGFVYYKSSVLPMTRIHGDSYVGIYEWRTIYIAGDCQAYFFLFETDEVDESGCKSTVRLPEDESLFFGTAFQPTAPGGEEVCLENHYFLHEDGSTVTLHDTPSWKNPTVLPCSGCDSARALAGLDYCPQITALAVIDEPRFQYLDSAVGPLPTPPSPPTGNPTPVPSSATPGPGPAPSDGQQVLVSLYLKVQLDKKNGNVFVYTYDKEDAILESAVQVPNDDDKSVLMKSDQAIASDGEHVCFIDSSKKKSVYCDGMATGIRAVTIDVHDSSVFAVMKKGGSNVIEVAAIAEDTPHEEIPTNLPPLKALAVGESKTCAIAKTEEMYCIDSPFSANGWVEVEGLSFQDAVIRDEHVFALTSGRGKEIVYATINDLSSWESVKDGRWTSIDYDPNSGYLCATRKKKVYCASDVDPSAEGWTNGIKMKKMNSNGSSIKEVTLKRGPSEAA